MAEWLKATVSKTVAPVSGAVGSNPTLSATPRVGWPLSRRGAGVAEQARLEIV